jgi:hypothetical protein
MQSTQSRAQVCVEAAIGANLRSRAHASVRELSRARALSRLACWILTGAPVRAFPAHARAPV